jgi:MFS family permease
MRIPSFALFLCSAGAWFAAMGMQNVVLPWLLTHELQLPPRWVGLVQTCAVLPAIGLLLPAGHWADRAHLRRHLVGLQLLAMLPILALAAALMRGAPGPLGMLAYALAMGAIGAFVSPAREAALGRVAGARLERGATAYIGVEYGLQMAGFWLASHAVGWGSAAVLVVQALLVLASAAAWAGLRGIGPPAAAAPRAAPGSLMQALRHLLRAAALRELALVNLMMGLCFLGAFFVLVPLAVVRHYGAGVDGLALANLLFMAGTLAAVAVLLVRRGLHDKARALRRACAAGAVLLGLLALGPPWPLFLLLLALWGATAGVALSMGQAIAQEQAPSGHKAATLSLLMLGFIAGQTLGSLLMGLLLEGLSPLRGALVPAVAMLGFVAAIERSCRLQNAAFRRGPGSGPPSTSSWRIPR